MVRRKRLATAACVGLAVMSLATFGCSETLQGASNQPTATEAAAPVPTQTSRDEFGLGTQFTYEIKKQAEYDKNQIDLTPNKNKVIDSSQEAVVYNNTQFNFDTMSGATPRYVRGEDNIEVDLDVKAKRMFWTVQPPLGIIKGEFYRAVKDFNGGYIATTDLVIDEGKIVHVEMDERGPQDYYEEKWANETKRRSGYGFFQAKSPRTHETLMVTPNAFNYLEWQILKNNSLNMPLQGVRGISNSARDAFIPEIKELKDTIEQPSGKFYAAIALPVEQGVVARLEVIFDKDKIVEAHYDEIFADRADDIAQEGQKKYERTSKKDSVDYKVDRPEFREFEKELTSKIIESQQLDVDLNDTSSALPEYANYKDLAQKLIPTVQEYKKHGQTHNIGSITKELPAPENFTPIYYRTDQLHVKIAKSVYDRASKTIDVTFEVTNDDAKPVLVQSDWFFLYVGNGKGFYDNVGAPIKSSVEIAGQESKEVTLSFGPILDDDKTVTFKYDGPNKTYVELGALSDIKKKD